MPSYLKPEEDGLPMQEYGPWTAEKLDYLERYIDVFETAMRQQWRIRYYVDLLAGSGKTRVEDSGTVLLGSALLALTTTYPFTGYFFTDLSEDKTATLRQRCAVSPLYQHVDIRTGDCNTLVDDIVAKIKADNWRSLNLAFLDPEGLELQWETIAKISTVRRMDLIINYPQGGLNRYMPIALEAEGQTAVDDFFGDREWRKIYAESLSKPGIHLHRQLMDHYKQKLQGLGYAEVVRDDETGDEPLMRNSRRNTPLYRLLFASKSLLGHEFWKKITRRDVHGQARLF